MPLLHQDKPRQCLCAALRSLWNKSFQKGPNDMCFLHSCLLGPVRKQHGRRVSDSGLTTKLCDPSHESGGHFHQCKNVFLFLASKFIQIGDNKHQFVIGSITFFNPSLMGKPKVTMNPMYLSRLKLPFYVQKWCNSSLVECGVR